MKKFFRREEGFTLIELLVVVAVLGILAALAIPRLTGVTDRARLAEAEQAIGSMKTGVEMYFVEHNSYTGLNTDPNNVTDGSAISQYIEFTSLPSNWDFMITADATTFTITATGTGVNANLGARINQANVLEITRNGGTNWNAK